MTATDARAECQTGIAALLAAYKDDNGWQATPEQVAAAVMRTCVAVYVAALAAARKEQR